MEGECGSPESILAYGLKMVKEVREAACERSLGSFGKGVGHPTSWVKPDAGWWKINVDAGCLGEWGIGLGLVCRDELGTVLGCATVQVQQGVCWEIRIAEAKAVLAGL